MPVASSKQIARASRANEPVSAKQAVAIAFRTFAEFYPQLTEANLMLEEIEEQGHRWLVTLGYDAKRALSPHTKLFQNEMYRAYKLFSIDNKTGKVASMKIKALE